MYNNMYYIYILYPISQNWFTLTNESTASQVSGSNPAQHFARAEWAMVLRPSLGYGGVLPGLGRLLHETDAIRTSLTEIGLQLDPMNTPEGRDPLGQNFFHGYQSNAQGFNNCCRLALKNPPGCHWHHCTAGKVRQTGACCNRICCHIKGVSL